MPYDDATLDRLRRQGDPVPDRIVADLAQRGSTDAVNELLRHLVHNAQPIPAALPDDIAAWLRETDRLPAGIDHDRLDRAADFFLEHGTRISLILCTSSLVECYAARPGCKALVFTYRLDDDTDSRIGETAQFVLRVMAPGAFDPGGEALPAIQKVRLMHAAIRYLIRRTGRWPEAELGVPICQEDMLGTLLAFSSVVLRDLTALGTPVNADQAEAYLYRWRVVGELSGIPPEVMPSTVTEAATVGAAIARRHHGPSPEGVALTHALLAFHAAAIPGDEFDGVVPALVRYLVGEQVADWMEVPRSRWQEFIRPAAALSRSLDVLDRNPAHKPDLVDRLAMALLTRRTMALTDSRQAAYDIPTHLGAVLGIPMPRDVDAGRPLPD